jgi:branched-chain amino acid transport system permease protein
MIAQYIANGLLIGSLYACLAVGFSLIYGVLNIINVMHGSFVVLGAYVTIYCTLYLGVSPLIAAMIGCAVLFAFGYLVQRHLINEVVTAPIFISFTLTFGLDLLLNNAMIQAFTATPRSLILNYGSITDFQRKPLDRAAGRHGPGIGADRTALLAAASFADGPRHHRGADGPLCGAAPRHSRRSTSMPSPSASAR